MLSAISVICELCKTGEAAAIAVACSIARVIAAICQCSLEALLISKVEKSLVFRFEYYSGVFCVKVSGGLGDLYSTAVARHFWWWRQSARVERARVL